MDAKLAPADQAFETEIALIFEKLARFEGEMLFRAWRDEVVARGWSVPKWPSAQGGMNWSATQHFLWDRACVRHVPDDPYWTGREIVGPTLLGLDDDTLLELVDTIRHYRQTWCVAVAEPGAQLALSEMTSFVSTNAKALRALNGGKCWVQDAAIADMCCCLYCVDGQDDLFELGAVELQAPGVTRREQSLTFDSVPIKTILWQGSCEQANQLAQSLMSRELGDAAALGTLEAQVEVLQKGLSQLSEADDLQTRLTALEVDLAGVKALQLRYLEALERAVATPFPQTVLQVRTRELAGKVGELLLESFGYYALPYPDPMLSHNEGRIAPPGSAPTPDHGVLSVSRLLAAAARAGYGGSEVSAGYADSVFALKDSLGGHLLAPPE